MSTIPAPPAGHRLPVSLRTSAVLPHLGGMESLDGHWVTVAAVSALVPLSENS